jgi:ferredoxin-type protein NapG
LNINKAKMGLAVVHKETCIAFWGIQCDVCYRACPLMDEAITLEYDKNERTGKHAFLKPVVNGEICTGCGLCEHACVTEKPAIKVLPVDVATGKVGDHYIKGWDKSDEKRLKSNGMDRQQPEGNENAIDYLNDWEDLIDE